MKVFSYIIVAATLVSTILAESYAVPPVVHTETVPPPITPAPVALASKKAPIQLLKSAPRPSITYENYKERCKNLSPEQKKKHDIFAFYAMKHCLEVTLKLKSYINSLSGSKAATVSSGEVAEKLKKLLSCQGGKTGKGGEHSPYGKGSGKPSGKTSDKPSGKSDEAKPAPGAEGAVKPAPDSGSTKPTSSAPAGDAKPAPSGGDTKPAPATGKGY